VRRERSVRGSCLLKPRKLLKGQDNYYQRCVQGAAWEECCFREHKSASQSTERGSGKCPCSRQMASRRSTTPRQCSTTNSITRPEMRHPAGLGTFTSRCVVSRFQDWETALSQLLTRLTLLLDSGLDSPPSRSRSPFTSSESTESTQLLSGRVSD
jgi:hypothetical protein